MRRFRVTFDLDVRCKPASSGPDPRAREYLDHLAHALVDFPDLLHRLVCFTAASFLGDLLSRREEGVFGPRPDELVDMRDQFAPVLERLPEPARAYFLERESHLDGLLGLFQTFLLAASIEPLGSGDTRSGSSPMLQ